MNKSILVAISLLYLSTSLFGWSLNSIVEDAVSHAVKKQTTQVKESKKEDEWKKAGFNSVSTKEWKKYVNSPDEAQKWLKAFGKSVKVENFSHMLNNRKGPSYAEIAYKWIQAGFTPEEASKWIKIGRGFEWSKVQKDKGITPEEALKKLEYDPLVKYFKDITPSPIPLYKKGEITFAGMGKHMGFYNMIKQICKVSSFTTINGYPKDEYCAENSKLSYPFEARPKETFKKMTWHKLYTENKVGEATIQGKGVTLTNIQSHTIVAKPLTLKGVDFEVHFQYQGDMSAKVLKGMIIDGKVPMTYYSFLSKDGELKRFVTFLHLNSIKLIPIKENIYFDQHKDLFTMFRKKFPDLKLNSSRSGYSYRKNGDSFEMLFEQYRKFIVYRFYNSEFGERYSVVYMKKQKEELMQKHDDSDSI